METAPRLRGVCCSHSKSRFNLCFQCWGVEWFDDVIANAGSLCRDDILNLIFAHHEDKWRSLQTRVASQFAQEGKADHRGQIPIRNHKAVGFIAHLGQCGRAITGFIYVYKTDLLQEAANNSNDRGGIGDDEYGHRSIDDHGSNPDARSAQSPRPSAHSVDFRRYLSNPRKGRQSCQVEVKIQLIAEIGQASDKQLILQRRTTVNFIRLAL